MKKTKVDAGRWSEAGTAAGEKGGEGGRKKNLFWTRITNNELGAGQSGDLGPAEKDGVAEVEWRWERGDEGAR